MDKPTKKKLTLTRETLKVITYKDLVVVTGGGTSSCSRTAA